MKTTFELITPERAKELLKNNSTNRPLTKPLYSEYARQMRNGLWFEFTCESIKIADDNTLIDGQHRLTALIEANVSLSFKIDYGVPKEAFLYIDTPKKRTARDIFAIMDVPNYTNVSAGIRRYLTLKQGKAIGFVGGGVTGTNRGKSSVSNAELLKIYESNPKMWNGACIMATSWYTKSGRILNISDFIGFYTYFRDISEDDAFIFMSKFGEGTNLSHNDPVKLLREKLTAAKINPIMNMSGVVKTAVIFKAWNYFRKGESIKVLRFSPSLDNFPIPK